MWPHDHRHLVRQQTIGGIAVDANERDVYEGREPKYVWNGTHWKNTDVERETERLLALWNQPFD